MCTGLNKQPKTNTTNYSTEAVLSLKQNRTGVEHLVVQSVRLCLGGSGLIFGGVLK